MTNMRIPDAFEREFSRYQKNGLKCVSLLLFHTWHQIIYSEEIFMKWKKIQKITKKKFFKKSKKKHKKENRFPIIKTQQIALHIKIKKKNIFLNIFP